jgi:hypothetical protein
MRSIKVDPTHATRSADLSARWDGVVREFENASDGEGALALAEEMETLLDASNDSPNLRNWRFACGLLRAMAVDMSLRATAKVRGADIAGDRGRLQVLLQEVDEIVCEMDDERLKQQLRAAYDLNAPRVYKKSLLPALAKVPLPTLYVAGYKHRGSHSFDTARRMDTVPRNPVLRLSAFLGNVAVSGTQPLEPHTLHTLRFQVLGTEWPENAKSLQIELLTTCPASLFHVSLFETEDRSGAPQFESVLVGNIRFDTAQSEAASDLVVSVRAAFLMLDGAMRAAHVVGQNHMRFRLAAPEEVGSRRKCAPTASAAKRLAPGQFDALQNALLDAYNYQSLQRMLRTGMNVRLDHIASNSSLRVVVADVIDWAEQEGRVEQLVREAATFVPGNPQLQQFVIEFGRMQSCP